MVGLDNPLHLIFLLVIVLLLFGAKRLPEMGRSLGTGMRSFKESLSGEVEHQQDPAAAGAVPAMAEIPAPGAENAAQPAEQRLAA